MPLYRCASTALRLQTPLRFRRSQYAPHPSRPGLLVVHWFTAEETDLPGKNVVFRIRCRSPIDFRLDIGEGVSDRQRGVVLGKIDQRLELIDGRTAPALLAADGLARAPLIGPAPHVVFRSEEHTSEPSHT